MASSLFSALSLSSSPPRVVMTRLESLAISIGTSKVSPSLLTCRFYCIEEEGRCNINEGPG